MHRDVKPSNVIPLRPEVEHPRARQRPRPPPTGIPSAGMPRERISGAETAAAIFVVVIVGVILITALLTWTSCSTPTDREPTWEGTWRWAPADVPIGVDAPGFDWSRELDSAIAVLNDAAGCRVLERRTGGPVHVELGDDLAEVRGWTEVHAVGDRITRAEVAIGGIGDIGTAHRVLVHELGRALGLAGGVTERDGEPPTSYMHRHIADREEFPWLVTTADSRALRGAYCR
jgi:hypothetical protein